ncbi:MAG: T9SS type A sorting domain-containing protein [Bacteroidetes bacterium]|nr:T9SS type A sorting domain-containing protein [Bacteroidota bacterium]
MKTKLLIISLIAFCEITNAQNTWVQKSFFGGGFRSDAVGFSIASKGYIGTGWSNTALTKDFWEYDTLTNAWSQKADFEGSPRQWAVGFSIGTKGYIGTGLDTCTVCAAHTKDFWEYNSSANTWTKKADFGGTARYLAVGFSIGAKGYIGTGNDGVSENDFWEYDTTLDSWTQKAFFPGLERSGAVGFSIGNKGYIGGGGGGGSYNDFWEYNPANDSWIQKAAIIAYGADYYATGFSIGAFGYVLTNNSGAGSNFAKYDPVTNKWTLVANLTQSRAEAVGFSIGNSGYIGTGNQSGRKKDFWKYTPCSSFTTATITASGSTTLCNGESVTLTANTGTSYVWWNGGVTTQSIMASTSGVYAVIVTDSCGTATSSPVTVTVQTCTGISDLVDNDGIIISPNPFSSSATLHTDKFFTGATLTVYNYYGQTVKQIRNISGQIVTLYRDNLPSGLYFIRLTEEKKTIAVDKLVITDK